MKTLEWRRNELIILDQTKLPAEETYRRCTSWQDVKDAISVLAVRGAPAIGVAAAYGLVLGASELLRRKITDTAVFSAGLANRSVFALNWQPLPQPLMRRVLRR